jgi:hypothetical protein
MNGSKEVGNSVCSTLMSHQLNTSLSLKSPRVIVAGVLFLAALLSSFAFAALSDRSSGYWVVSHPVAAGSLLTSGDLELIDASLVDNQDLYLAEDLSPIGSTTTRYLAAGEFVATSAVTEDLQEFDAEQVPLNIAASDIPETIEIGEPISIYWVPEPQDAQSLSTPELLLTGIFLRSIDRKSSNFGNGLAITVSVDNSQVQRLLAGTSNGRLVIVKSNG